VANKPQTTEHDIRAENCKNRAYVPKTYMHEKRFSVIAGRVCPLCHVAEKTRKRRRAVRNG
jgi:hypothetical protein